MVRSRRSISKEDASSILADSGVSLSSPSAAHHGNATSTIVIDISVVNAEDINDDDDDEIIDDDDDVIEDDDDVLDDDDDGDDDELIDESCDIEHENAIDNDDDDDNDDEEDNDGDYVTDDDDDGNDKSDENYDYDVDVDGESRIDSTKSKPNIQPRTAKSPSKRSIKSKANTPKSTRSVKTVSRATILSGPSAKKQRKLHVCLVCDKEFGGKTDLKRHMLIHSNERPHKCIQCNKSYRQAVNLKNHITSAHNGQKQFQCQLCPKAFALKERLRLHMRLHSGDKPYACSMCDKRFPRGGQLQQHKITHHKDSTIRQFHCEICSSSFSTAANLRAHQQRHEQGPDHFCEICKEHFPNDVILRAHINKVHYKLKQFDCDICKETVEDDDFAEHMKNHTHVKTHVCQVCQAYFTQKSQYNVHMRMHTGERPYQCRICWQTFAHSSVLKLHIRKHTGEKPFQCLLCKEDQVAFSQLAHLKTHMKKIHKQCNPYMCTGCSSFFKVKADLQLHMEKCPHCEVNNEAQCALQQEQQTLSHLRFHIALLLKKISSEQKLHQLGYEKRLIDNVVVASLKLANRKAYDDHKLSAIERMRLNVQEFLNWIVPPKVMENFQQEELSVECILDKIVTMYTKQK